MPRTKDTFLNKEGLEYYHSKLKQEFSSKDELDKKQDVLTEENAGAGVSIETNEDGKVIISSTSSSVNWGDILGDITDQQDLVDFVPEIKSNTTSFWNNARGYIPKADAIIIYTDYSENAQAIKIGDGTTYVQDLPFVGDDVRDDLLAHINNTSIHVTSTDKETWNNKININDTYDILHNRLENETLVFTRE